MTGSAISYLLRVPCNRADSFAANIVEGEALFLRLDIPDGHETGTASSNQNVSDLFVPVQALNIVCAGRIVAQPERVFDVVQVGNKELALGTTGGQEVGVFGVELESLDRAGVFRGP